MKIAVIGGGPSGLVSAKYALEQGHDCDVFEQTGSLGGVWTYTDQTGIDENGVRIHSAMYTGLITNLPKEVMAFLDFPYPEQNKSYLPQPEVLDYLTSCADHFNLQPHIKYYKCVTKVQPLLDKKWTVTVQDISTKTEESNDYDAVFVCNGHYRDPIIPEIPGQDVFKGPQWHSQNYRTPEPFENKKVLFIGAGPSGQEISKFISEVTKVTYLSRRGGSLLMEIPETVTEKPVVERFYENGAVFEDRTTEEFDMILYCTGYKYSFPFLTEECGIKVDENWVHPLYKHVINIEDPTMYFIGIPFFVCLMPTFDIQARFALAALAGKFTLPPKEDMLKELEQYMCGRKERGLALKKAHQIGKSEEQKEYFQDLAETAGIRNVPSVITKLYARIIQLIQLKTWSRKQCFKIIDDDNFIQTA